MERFTEKDNLVFDRIVTCRRTDRAFRDELPPRELIEKVVEAGKQAPFAAISAGDIKIFRQFYIVPNGSPVLAKVSELIQSQTTEEIAKLEKEMEENPFIRDHAAILHGIWSSVAKNGVPGLLSAPYLILVAEWRGARRAEKQSLAHLMQNMWLKATALNLGFMLVSPIEDMVYNREFCSLLEKEPGLYGFHGCVVGYPKNDVSDDSIRKDPKKAGCAVKWM